MHFNGMNELFDFYPSKCEHSFLKFSNRDPFGIGAFEMEDFNYFTNDFLSNGGFQQLYSTIEYPDEILWDTKVIGDNGDYYDSSAYLDHNLSNWQQQTEHAFNYDYLMQNSICEEYATDDSPQYYNFDMDPMPSESSDPVHKMNSLLYNQWNEVNSTSYDQYEINTNDQCQLIETDWEFNLDTLLLDNGFDSTPTSAPLSDLPDRTFFCNDSCNIFLKESSDNLNSNLQSFLPRTNATSLESECPEQTAKRQRSAGGNCASGDENRVADDKSFICTFNNCGKVYAKAGHLKAHIRRHVGDKPYVCLWPNCTWKFSRSDELSRHRRSHSGVKPYKCDYCPKQFSRSDHLSKHRKVHERKMAAMKMKAVWTTIPQGRPGRRPKVLVPQI